MRANINRNTFRLEIPIELKEKLSISNLVHAAIAITSAKIQQNAFSFQLNGIKTEAKTRRKTIKTFYNSNF
jgi:hypothetical protein